ncbi:hypothetical protein CAUPRSCDRAFT_12666 [Caulochytrium protostelioides]|nr:hypothetical protein CAUPRSCDRAFT_12666 [Caulochytrium protostelioides]
MQLLQAMTALRARAAQNVVHDALAPRAANPPVAARAACDAVDAAIEQIAALDPRHAPFADPFHFGPHLERYDADVEQRLASFQATTLRLMQSYVAGLGASALLLPAVLAAGVSVATALPVAALTAAAVTAAARWRWLRAIRRLDSRLCRHRAALEHDLVADYRRLGASHWSQPSHIAISELITSLDAQLAETRLTIEQLQQLAHATTR